MAGQDLGTLLRLQCRLVFFLFQDPLTGTLAIDGQSLALFLPSHHVYLIDLVHRGGDRKIGGDRDRVVNVLLDDALQLDPILPVQVVGRTSPVWRMFDGCLWMDVLPLLQSMMLDIEGNPSDVVGVDVVFLGSLIDLILG